jgi:hypothetical protein
MNKLFTEDAIENINFKPKLQMLNNTPGCGISALHFFVE